MLTLSFNQGITLDIETLDIETKRERERENFFTDIDEYFNNVADL
jgi:hypothetical protein